MKLRCLILLTLVISSRSEAFEVSDELALRDSTVYIVDPEFDYASNKRMLWHDNKGSLWLAWVNPNDASILPADGRMRLLDVGVAPPQKYGKGAEWAYGADGTYIVYNNFNQEIVALKKDGDEWRRVDLGDTQRKFNPIGTPPGSQTARMGYYYVPPEGYPMQLHVRDIPGDPSPLPVISAGWMATIS